MRALEEAMQTLPLLSSTKTVEGSVASLLNSSQGGVASRWRVLIVDDHNSIRQMIRIVLESYTDIIEVIGEASDGEEAVAQAEHSPIDLVLMDVNLPHMNGIDATRQIKKVHPDVVILGISAEYTPHVYNSMIAAGAVAFVRKEDAADLLFRTIVFAMCTYRPARVDDPLGSIQTAAEAAAGFPPLTASALRSI